MKEIDIGIIVPTLGIGDYVSDSLISIFSVLAPLNGVCIIVCPRKVKFKNLPPFNERLRIVEDIEMTGLYPAINCGVRFLDLHYHWKYFTYLNDDDILLPPFVDMMRDLLKRDVVTDIGYGGCEFTNNESECLGTFSFEPYLKRIPSLFLANIIGLQQPGTVICKQMWETCGPFDTSYKLCGDMKLLLNVCRKANYYYYSKKSVSRFRIHAQQLSSDRTTVLLENARIRKEVMNNEIFGLKGILWIVFFRFRNLLNIASSFRRRKLLKQQNL